MSPHLSVEIAEVIDSPWTAVSAMAVGSIPTGRGTPNLYALVREDGEPAFRIDVYGNRNSESYFRSEAVAWRNNVVIGFGWRVFFINALTRGAIEVDLDCYFESLRAGSEYLLVVFGTGILRLDPRGSVVWENSDLAIDGVAIQGIEGDLIRGVGEWDPPGDWRGFTISLTSGRSTGSSTHDASSQ